MSRYYGFAPYVPVAVRREKAAREMAKLAKKGRVVSPVTIEGRAIAKNFWGKAWCDNLESYSDYENRLPRGRTYVRNGSVVDLQVDRGRVRAIVSGSELYSVEIEIATLPKPRWEAICRDCLGSVGSLVELLQGKLSKNVMERVCSEDDGLFPSPDEITMSCSCPDSAGMCKHISAALYGVGARLDVRPDVLFDLRGVDRSQLIAGAGKDLPLTRTEIAGERVLADDDVAALFGIEMDAAPAGGPTASVAPAAKLRKPAPVRAIPSPTVDAKVVAMERPASSNRSTKPAADAKVAPASGAMVAKGRAEAASGAVVQMARPKSAAAANPGRSVAAASNGRGRDPGSALLKPGGRVPLLAAKWTKLKRPKSG